MDRAVAPKALHAILEDLHDWGADRLDAFKARVGEATTSQLVLDRFVRLTDGNDFVYVALGSRGRRHFGLRPNHTVEPSAAAHHIMRREAKARLELLGLTYLGAEDRVLRRFEDAQGRAHFLATSLKPGSRGYTARAVRRLLDRYGTLLLQTNGVLVIATPHPGRLTRTLAKHEDLLKVLEVDGSIARAGKP